MNTVTPPEAFVSHSLPLPQLNVDFAHVNTWVFDLDNTLYSHESRIWPQIDERISLYLSDMFGFDAISARALQKYYYHLYGTTLKGLMEEHKIDSAEFLDFVHSVDLSSLHPEKTLSEAIGALSGRKLIMTNGSRQHAENITTKLGIREHFEDIFDIQAANFVPKPEHDAYQVFMDKHHVNPKTSAMFEDIAKNLITPHSLGMRTVLVLPKTPDPFREMHEQVAIDASYVQYTTHHLTDFLTSLNAVLVSPTIENHLTQTLSV